MNSAVLEHAIAYHLYLPASYADTALHYPVLYLLHGRGDTLDAWTCMLPQLDALIAAGRLPPLIVVMPDAPWSNRAGYYIDSQYTGAGAPGARVETAFIDDLLPHIDATHRTVAARRGRVIGGYSMGGYGALRYALAYPALFSAALVLSPAVYVPVPPADSSMRAFGAFGSGTTRFVESIYQAHNYPALLPRYAAHGVPLQLCIAVGDDEYQHPDPVDAAHDIRHEARRLYTQAARIKNISAELRVLHGGHDWDVWEPGFVAGMTMIAPLLASAANCRRTHIDDD